MKFSKRAYEKQYNLYIFDLCYTKLSTKLCLIFIKTLLTEENFHMESKNYTKIQKTRKIKPRIKVPIFAKFISAIYFEKGFETLGKSE